MILLEFCKTLIQSSRQEGVVDDKFSYFSSEPHVVTPHLNQLVTRRVSSDEGSQHMFLCRIKKNYPYLSPKITSYLEL